jgi:hypothetical protein
VAGEGKKERLRVCERRERWFGCSFFYLFMTTFEAQKAQEAREEIKAWMHADVLRTLDEMGYSSYQEYLDEMEQHFDGC